MTRLTANSTISRVNHSDLASSTPATGDDRSSAPPIRRDDKNKWVCSDCGYSERNSFDVRKHIRAIHLCLQPYKCNDCNTRCALRLQAYNAILTRQYRFRNKESTNRHQTSTKHLNSNITVEDGSFIIQCILPQCSDRLPVSLTY